MTSKQANRYVKNSELLTKIIEPYTQISETCVEFETVGKPKIQFHLQSNRWVVFLQDKTKTLYGDLVACLNWYHTNKVNLL